MLFVKAKHNKTRIYITQNLELTSIVARQVTYTYNRHAYYKRIRAIIETDAAAHSATCVRSCHRI